MRLGSWLTDLLSDFSQLFYPRLCVCCDNVLAKGEEHICFDCRCKLAHTHLHETKGNSFEQRFYGRVKVEMATTFLYFEKGNLTQKILHGIKYRGFNNLGEAMGIEFGAVLKGGRWEQIDYLIPVPLHPDKLKVRGYNQAECIANGIGKALEKPVVTDVLYRKAANTTQTKKTAEERRENVKNIFAAHNLNKVEGKHIAIVDDVLTTGATLEACAKAFGDCNVRISMIALASAEK
ncbi:MAG: ComF family protein [Paludibacteraceae bacterium]|nr:ComF family protein [Paludibacteraceae bacterium]